MDTFSPQLAATYMSTGWYPDEFVPYAWSDDEDSTQNLDRPSGRIVSRQWYADFPDQETYLARIERTTGVGTFDPSTHLARQR